MERQVERNLDKKITEKQRIPLSRPSWSQLVYQKSGGFSTREIRWKFTFCPQVVKNGNFGEDSVMILYVEPR